MSVASCLIEEVAGIGAKIETTGNGLVLRAGPNPIPSQLVRRVRDAKSELIAVLRTKSFESQVVRWLDDHPVPSPVGRCSWCGKHDRPGAVVLPFGTEIGMHAWLHAECWRPWHASRRANAASALAGLVVVVPWSDFRRRIRIDLSDRKLGKVHSADWRAFWQTSRAFRSRLGSDAPQCRGCRGVATAGR